jgi:hypothetical protein
MLTGSVRRASRFRHGRRASSGPVCATRGHLSRRNQCNQAICHGVSRGATTRAPRASLWTRGAAHSTSGSIAQRFEHSWIRAAELSAGERLILIKGLVPGLVEEIGLGQFHAFLAEIATKARRFQEAVDHPGEGRASRTTAGEELGGPTPAGHEHLAIAREPDCRGAREAERVIETELWSHAGHVPRTDTHE